MLNDSNPKRVKGVLQTMIDGIRVDARDQATLRVPAARIESGYMELWCPRRFRTRVRGGLVADG
jgi:hypothetical protein